MPKRATFSLSDLEIVEHATHEPVVLGDFVLLASGSPQGLVVAAEAGTVTVAWLNGHGDQSVLPSVCVRPNAVRHI